MKKTIVLFTIFISLLLLTGCGSNDSSYKNYGGEEDRIHELEERIQDLEEE